MANRFYRPAARLLQNCRLGILLSRGDRLSTVLDDYSRYIIHWELFSSMKADDVKRTIDQAVKKAGIKSKAKPNCSLITEPVTYLASWMNI